MKNTRYKLVQTTDYDSLNLDQKNRPINKGHVNKLIESISERNLLHLRPGSVGKDNIIIDGQHRLLAAKELQIPFWYVKDEEATIEDAPILNMHQMNWSLPQWEHYWIESGEQDYKILRKYRKKYNLPISIAISLLYEKSAHASGRNQDIFRAGNFEVRHMDFAEDIATMLTDISNYADHAKTQTFILALLSAIRTGEYDHEHFIRKLEMAPHTLSRQATRKDNLRNIEDVYNYKESNRVRFF